MDTTNRDPYPELPVPAGPDAARLAARRQVAAGRHAHLVVDGEIECLSGRCTPTTLMTGV